VTASKRAQDCVQVSEALVDEHQWKHAAADDLLQLKCGAAFGSQTETGVANWADGVEERVRRTFEKGLT
jgi:hypothetical protein